MAKKTKPVIDVNALVELSRNELYKQIKPTIDAANKRLKRQGKEIKLSTKGKNKIELVELYNEALSVPTKPKPKIAAEPKPKIAADPKPKIAAEPRPKIAAELKPKRPVKVVKQLPDDVSKLKRSELIQKLQPTIDAANKRLKRLQNMNTLSPALNSAMESGGKFAIKGKSRNEVLKEASRAIAFINMKTSTVSGSKSFEANFQKKLSNKAKGITNEQRKVLFDSFRKLQQISPVGLNIYGSDRLIRMLADEVTESNYTFEETMNKALNELTQAYENFQSEYDDLDPFDL